MVRVIPTSKDVADRAGVSRSTVSQILNGRSGLFTDDTKAKVERAVAELGYQPSAAGRALARGSSDIVIALIPDTTFGHNLQDIYGPLTDELARRGLILVLRLSNHTEDALDRLVVGMKPRAILTITSLPEQQRALLVRRGVEVIEPSDGDAHDVNAHIGAMQADHLISRGYRRLAFAHLVDTRSDPFGGARQEAFTEQCRTAGLDAPRILRLGVTPEEAVAALDDLEGPGAAVACYNDEVAAALLYAAREREWQVPRDLAVIGMDNTPLSRLTAPPLTTMGYDPALATQASLRTLLARLDRSEEGGHDFALEVTLVQRSTT